MKKCQTIKSQKLWWSGMPETIAGMAAYMVSKNFSGEKIPETIALAGYIKNKICEPTKKEQQLLL